MLVLTIKDNEKIYIGELVVSANLLSRNDFFHVHLENLGIKFYSNGGDFIKVGSVSFFFEEHKNRIRIHIDAPLDINIQREKLRKAGVS